MSDTYADVDGSADPSGAVAWQDRVAGWPQVRAMKRRALELLAGADPVLDVGCGPGGDVAELGGRGIGLDASMAMCAIASGRGVTVCRGDAHALPFATGSVGGVRTDRVLQHVGDPDGVLDEVVRIARPGSRVVLVEPDQETLVIEVPGVGRHLTDRLKALRRDVGYRNGRLASTLPAALRARGVTDVTAEPFGLLLTEPFELLLTDPDDAFGLPTWPAHWRALGGFDDADLAAWDRAMGRARVEGMVYAVTFLVVAGTTGT